MKKSKLTLYALLFGVFFSGCAQKGVILTQSKLCEAPITTLYIQNVQKKGGVSTFNEDAFKTLLNQTLKETGCVNLANSKEGYITNVSYEVQITNKEDESTFSSKSLNTLKATIVFNLSNQEELRKEVGTSTITTEGKKILGMGDSGQVTRQDEENALRNSVLVILKNLIKTAPTDVAPTETMQYMR